MLANMLTHMHIDICNVKRVYTNDTQTYAI